MISKYTSKLFYSDIYYHVSIYISIYLAPECGKKSLHYGGICCYSCRAFFRRAHQNTKTPFFSCRRASQELHSVLTTERERMETQPQTSGQCGYDVTTKRQCQYHRLKRCLEIGMLLVKAVEEGCNDFKPAMS